MKNIVYAAILGSALLSTGCSESVLDLKNPAEYNEDTYYKTQKECQEAVLSCYSVFTMAPFYSREWYYMFDLMSNQAAKTEKLSGLAQFGMFVFQQDNNEVRTLWEGLYRMNMRALVALEKVSAWETKAEEEKTAQSYFIGEAYFFHAWAYYNLTELFGDVPYHESWLSIKEEPAKPRMAYSEIQPNIEAALKEAIKYLPEEWDEYNLGRITKNAARTLLGKHYLTLGKNEEAVDILSQVSGVTLSSDYCSLFDRGNHTNQEIILQVLHKNWGRGEGSPEYVFGGKESWGGKSTNTARHLEYGFNDWHNVYVPDASVAKFKYSINGKSDYIDPRGKMIYYGDGVLGDEDFAGGAFPYIPYNGTLASGFQWKKYCSYETEEHMIMDNGDISSVLLRLADVKLMLAEAYIALNQYDKALEEINEVRERVGAEKYNNITSANAFEILKRERYIELYGEQQYWFDLIRWDRLGKMDMMSELPEGTNPKYKKFPIPITEIDENPQMIVENGWN